MKMTRRFFALALALVMILGLATTAFAAEGDYTITITNSDSISSAGHKYYAYQIFGGKLDSTGTILSDIEWGENIVDGNAFIAALKGETAFGEGEANIFYNATTAAQVATLMAKTENQTSTKIEAFAKVATARVVTDGVAAVASSTQNDAPYTITIPAAKPGYYLVKDTLIDTTAENKDISDFILQVVGNVSVEHKGSIPTMDKQVSETGSTYHDSVPTGVNETHYYRIVAELPDDYRLYDNYYLEFSDKMSVGLTYDAIVEVKALIRSSGATLTIDPACYTVSTSTLSDPDNSLFDGGTHLQVVIQDTKVITTTAGEIITLTAEDAIEVIYTAHVNAAAVIDGNGIPNTATIIYSNDPNTDGKGKTHPDETNVYPINLDIVKTDSTGNIKLAGAKFVLARNYSHGTDSHYEYAVLDAEGKISKWVHHIDGVCDCTNESDIALHAGQGAATVLESDNEGRIDVDGLKPGRYTLIEIEAPNGYNMLAEPVELSVSITIDEVGDKIATMTGNTNIGSIDFDVASATVKIVIPNHAGDLLPSTGGMGTTLFYVFGTLMVAAAAVLLITKKRMA